MRIFIGILTQADTSKSILDRDNQSILVEFGVFKYTCNLIDGKEIDCFECFSRFRVACISLNCIEKAGLWGAAESYRHKKARKTGNEAVLRAL